MANKFVRKTGSDSNNGTSAALAWATIGKALGATGMASGDTLYIGAGIYRETVTVNFTPGASTTIIGDVDGSFTGDVGEVRWTAYTTNDKTAPSSNATLKLNGKANLNFQNIVFVGGSNSTIACVDAHTTKGSNNCSFTDCTFIVGSVSTSDLINYQLDNDGGFPPAGIASNLTIDRCRFLLSDANGAIRIGGSTIASELDYNIKIQNNLFVGSQVGRSAETRGIIYVLGSINANNGSFNPGGFRIYNNTCISAGAFLYTENCASGSYTTQTHPYNNVMIGCVLNTTISNSMQEDYNLILSSQTTSNCQNGGHSVVDGSYSSLIHVGQEIPQGRAQRHFASPTVDSPILGFGGLTVPTYDVANGIRPAGSRQWSNASDAIGCLEYANGGVKETLTFRSNPSSVKIAGPGYHDFDFPVDAVTTTIGVYNLKDIFYAGLSPQMQIINGTECGVASGSVSITGAVPTAWNQGVLTFTPTSKGIVTIRLISNDTSTNGNCYFDDFSVS